MILGTFGDYSYRFYGTIDARLMDYYHYAHNCVKRDGNAVINMAGEVEVAIILEKDEKIIAATFLNVTKRDRAVVIYLIFVEPEFRNKHIHRTMHLYIDEIGKKYKKELVVSSVHANNKVMLDYIVDKIGYEPYWITFKRNINE